MSAIRMPQAAVAIRGSLRPELDDPVAQAIALGHGRHGVPGRLRLWRPWREPRMSGTQRWSAWGGRSPASHHAPTATADAWRSVDLPRD
jgi:hypothetical protein